MFVSEKRKVYVVLFLVLAFLVVTGLLSGCQGANSTVSSSPEQPLVISSENNVFSPDTSNTPESLDSVMLKKTNWQPTDDGSGMSNDFSAIFFLDTQTGWVSAGNKLYGTCDSGATWSCLGTTPGNLVALDFLDRENGWGISQVWQGEAYDYAIFQTIDGGKTWSEHYSYEDSSQNIAGQNRLRCFDATRGYALFADQFLQTDDGGKTWTNAIPSAQDFKAEDMSFLDAMNGYACGVQDSTTVLYKTTDAGKTWSPTWSIENLTEPSHLYPAVVDFTDTDPAGFLWTTMICIKLQMAGIHLQSMQHLPRTVYPVSCSLQIQVWAS